MGRGNPPCLHGELTSSEKPWASPGMSTWAGPGLTLACGKQLLCLSALSPLIQDLPMDVPNQIDQFLLANFRTRFLPSLAGLEPFQGAF
mmetsp:Transcript_52267/g.83431  ORF Transcript_52267/g.83431 Transcript_52267/m.83431 type:complete len:89 (-) Transcript_52267:219-485(-)